MRHASSRAALLAILFTAACSNTASSDERGTQSTGAESTKRAPSTNAPSVGDLRVVNENKYPTRIAQGGPARRIYVTDALVGSLFIYDADLVLVGEIKGLERPLGVAVNAAGTIYVGNDGRDNIEMYDGAGVKLRVIDNIEMPNDLALDRAGNLYVADSIANIVKVFSPSGQWVRNIGGLAASGEALAFPVAVTIATNPSGTEEIFVADQGNAQIKIYTPHGQLLRVLGGPVPAFSNAWQGLFGRPQDLAVDSQRRLHVLDSLMNHVQIVAADTGDYLDVYSSFGKQPGALNTPLGLLISDKGDVIITNSGNRGLETFPGF